MMSELGLVYRLLRTFSKKADRVLRRCKRMRGPLGELYHSGHTSRAISSEGLLPFLKVKMAFEKNCCVETCDIHLKCMPLRPSRRGRT